MDRAVDAYTLALAIIAASTLPPAYMAASIALAAIELCELMGRRSPALAIASLALTPLVASRLLGSWIYASLASAPTLMPVKSSLKARASPSWVEAGATLQAKALAIALASLAATSLLLAEWAVAVVVAACLAMVAALYARALGRPLIEASPARVRVLHGDAATVRVRVANRSRSMLHVAMRLGQPWASVKPSELTLPPGLEAELSLSAKPPLSAPVELVAEASVIDEHGLHCHRVELELAQLRVVPRAKVARWLAAKLVEGRGVATAAAIRGLGLRGRDEYVGSRPFITGDRLRDVDWKATLRRWRLSVRDYRGSSAEPLIVAGNVDASSVEEADTLHYAILSQGITAVRESTSTSLALYGDDSIIASTGPLDPRLALREMLRALDRARLVSRPRREVGVQVYEVEGPLRAIELRRAMLRWAVERSPAVKALRRAMGSQPPPATLTLATTNPEDLESSSRELAAARRRGYRVLMAPLK